MRKIIAVLKIITTSVYTLGIYFIFLAGFILLRMSRQHPEPWRNVIMKTWSNGLAKILSLEIEVKGNPPEPPFFLVSNHLSYIDIVVLYSVLKATFISKLEVKYWPVIGFMTKTLGVIFIDRKKKRDVARVNKIVSTQINTRQGIVLFPEGGTSPGTEVLPFRPALMEHPAAEKIDVSYAAIHYSTGNNDEPAYKSVSWWGKIPFHQHIFKVAMNKKIHATLQFGKTTMTHKNRKILAGSLHQAVSELFIPMVSKEEYKLEKSITG